MIKKVSQLEAGMYQDAAQKGQTLTHFLEDLARKGELSTELYNPELRDSQGRSVDAFRQILATLGVRTKGRYADTADSAFFSDSSNRVLFPEWVAREYRDAERPINPNYVSLDDLVSVREGINQTAYRTGVIASGQEANMEFSEVLEGTELPRYKVALSEHAINLKKYGGILQMSYEFVRRQSLAMTSRFIGKVARSQRRRKIKAALAVALNGDGNSNAAPNTDAGASWGTDDLIDILFASYLNDTEGGILITDATEMKTLVKLDWAEAHDTTAPQGNFRGSGTLPSFLGMGMRLALPGSVLDGAQKIMLADQQEGLIEVYETGSEITESENLIQSQFQVITFSENLAYAKPELQAFRTSERT